jgi:AcrR family transcriptional regulator
MSSDVAISPPALQATPSAGRARQRRRTRRALLLAAQELMEAGRTPSVAEAADAADVSRATAYRYFPSQDALLTEAALLSSSLSVEDVLGPDAPGDVEERVALVQRAFYEHISSHEPQFRHFLRAELLRGLQDPDSPRTRVGIRVTLLEAALAPLAGQLPPQALERLRNTLSVLIGTESVIVARDVLHLEHDAARAQLEWACRAVVRAALQER